jgi:hypothetical protein
MVNPATQTANSILIDRDLADDDRRGSSSDIAFALTNTAAPMKMTSRATID